MIGDVKIAPEIFHKFPDYSVVVLHITGVHGAASNDYSEQLLQVAENSTRQLLESTPLDDLPEVKRWREAFESFGVRPRVARSSFEALMRRIDKGLPRIDLLTDIYNAVSVLHRIPIGGENLDAYSGSPRLLFANGSEIFDTRENGETMLQHPEPGEVVWCDDNGVTCRRWNWRQCVRTRLDTNTTSLIFIVDGLGDDSTVLAERAAGMLSSELTTCWPSAEIASRTVTAHS